MWTHRCKISYLESLTSFTVSFYATQMKNVSLLRASCALQEKACKISYLESFRDLYVPQCCQLDARSKHPEVFSLCEPEHLPVPEVHGKEAHRRHTYSQFAKDDYPSKRAALSGKAWTPKPNKNVSVGRETNNTIQRKPVSYKQALAVVEPGRA